MTHGYNVRVMNIADDHKPFSHRVPPLLHLDCPVAATAAADDRTNVSHLVGVAAYEPMISWFFGQFDGQSRRTLWQAIRQQIVPASCRAGVLAEHAGLTYAPWSLGSRSQGGQDYGSAEQ